MSRNTGFQVVRTLRSCIRTEYKCIMSHILFRNITDLGSKRPVLGDDVTISEGCNCCLIERDSEQTRAHVSQGTKCYKEKGLIESRDAH
jgi:hypothetical protein